LAFEELGRIQLEDLELLDIIQKLERREPCHSYVLSRGVLHCPARNDGRPKVVAPTAAVPMVFAYFHNSPMGGHLGVFKTINKIRAQFIWKGMDNDILVRVRNCSQHRMPN
jgi:hypothetical protein